MMCSLLLALAMAQSPADLFSKAPPAIDQALRERVAKFYQAHLEGKFRVADQYVAEDSKDTFFEADKRRCTAFEVTRIDYTDEFQKATVVITCDTEVLLPPKGRVSVKMPLPSKWKVDNGQWWWYVPASNTRESPFGKMVPGPKDDGETRIPKGPTVAELRQMVRADKKEISFPPNKQQSKEVMITSSMPGVVKLIVQPGAAPDVQVTLDRVELKEKETAVVTLRYEPDAARLRTAGMTEVVKILVEPSRQVIPIQIEFRQ